MTVHTTSRAKLNWYLRVLHPRPDGFHNLESVFQEIAASDALTFAAIAEPRCRIDGFPPDVPAETNLITRAWQLLRREYGEGVQGLHCTAEKYLPRGGGLGGGSSNAAAALRAVDQLYGLGSTAGQLEAWGAELGSDVPFFVRGGCQWGEGRGERLTPLPTPPEYHLVLLFPPEGVSTKEAFARLSTLRGRSAPPPDVRPLLDALPTGDPAQVGAAIYNDFELAVADEPWFQTGKQAMERAGSLRAFLCGSGSTIAGLAQNAQDAFAIEQHVQNFCPYTSICTRSLTA